MGSKYIWGEKPIQDFFIESLMKEVDISNKKNIEYITNHLLEFYKPYLINENDIVYLDFNIKSNKFGEFKIIANNIITALWLIGIIPTNSIDILKANIFEYNDLKYTFNQKTRELKIEKNG